MWFFFVLLLWHLCRPQKCLPPLFACEKKNYTLKKICWRLRELLRRRKKKVRRKKNSWKSRRASESQNSFCSINSHIKNKNQRTKKKFKKITFVVFDSYCCAFCLKLNFPLIHFTFMIIEDFFSFSLIKTSAEAPSNVRNIVCSAFIGNWFAFSPFEEEDRKFFHFKLGSISEDWFLWGRGRGGRGTGIAQYLILSLTLLLPYQLFFANIVWRSRFVLLKNSFSCICVLGWICFHFLV